MNASSNYAPDLDHIKESIPSYDEYQLIELMFKINDLETFEKCLHELVLKVSNNVPGAKPELSKDELEEHINVLRGVLDRFGRNTLWRLENKALSLGLNRDFTFAIIRKSLYGPLATIYRNGQLNRMKVPSYIES